jgi:LPS export ABC transporter protein LptC
MPDLPDQEIESFRLTQTRDGRPQWVLTAERASIYESKDTVHAPQLEIEFYGGEGEIVSVLTANGGTLFRKTNNMEATGNVVVVRTDGTTLKTEQLRWNEEREKIESDVYVEVTKGSDVMTGEGLECDIDLENIKVKRNFKAYVLTETGERVPDE